MPAKNDFVRAGRYDIARAVERWGGLYEVRALRCAEVLCVAYHCCSLQPAFNPLALVAPAAPAARNDRLPYHPDVPLLPRFLAAVG
jgi:hypothetical protein